MTPTRSIILNPQWSDLISPEYLVENTEGKTPYYGPEGQRNPIQIQDGMMVPLYVYSSENNE